MKNLRSCLYPAAVFLMLGCGTMQNRNNTYPRTAVNVPEKFETKTGEMPDGSSCSSPLIDPRDGTEIVMVEAGDGVGKYRAPEGKYGNKGKELLSVDCRTGEVLGIIKK